MLTRLFLLFTVVPAVELYLLFQLSHLMGALPTVALVIVTGMVGATLARSQGFAVLRRIQAEAAQGFPSGNQLTEGLLIVIGGVLLVTPGVLTDFFGICLIAPPTRRYLAPRLKTWFLARAAEATLKGGAAPAPPHSGDSTAPATATGSQFDHPVA
jgi:UPF0716 protein FxsA